MIRVFLGGNLEFISVCRLQESEVLYAPIDSKVFPSYVWNLNVMEYEDSSGSSSLAVVNPILTKFACIL